MMDPQLRAFTVQEVNELIPTLTQFLNEIKAGHKLAIDLETQIDALELITEKGSEKSVRDLNKLVEKHHKCVSEFYAIVDQVHNLGCLVKDVELGLIDFYSVIEGKVVYLCWKLGEEKVGFWHEVGKGYTSRQPLNFDEHKGED